MRINVNLIERAEVLAAHVMRTLTDGAVDIRILSVIHGKCLLSARRSFFAVQR